MSPRRILSVSWVGQGDFGDEAMAFAMRKALAQRGLTPPTYYQQGPWPRFAADDEPPLTRIHPHSRRDVVRRALDLALLREFDTVLIGGGSLFHSERSIVWKHDIVRRVRARHPDAVAAAIGVSIGPFGSPAASRAFSAFAHDVDLFVTRDDSSAELARATGTSAEIVAAVDLSFLLPGFLGERFPLWAADAKGPIGISPVRHVEDESFEREGRFHYFLQVVNAVLAAGSPVRLFTLYVGPAYCDGALNARLKAECDAPERVEIHTFDGDIVSTSRAIAECGALCAQRLHALLFAFLSRVPLVSLGYHPKNAHACATLGYPARYVFEQEHRPDSAALVTLLLELASGTLQPYANARSVSSGAAVAASGFDSFAAKCRS